MDLAFDDREKYTFCNIKFIEAPEKMAPSSI